MAAQRICLLGFGEVGQVLATGLSTGRSYSLSAWDIRFDDAASAPSLALASRAVRRGLNALDAVAGADLVISAVTAAQAVAAVSSAVGRLKPQAWFMDVNSVSPGTKRQAGELVERSGGRYVEAAIMSPIAPRGLAAPMLLGGLHAQAFLPVAHSLGFAGATFFSDELGRASAAKMCRSVLIKGLESLLAESLTTARYFGVEDTVLNSLNSILPGDEWPRLARYMISRSLVHGRRRAEEMQEVSRTVQEAGMASRMSVACVEWQLWAAERAAAAGCDELTAMLDQLLVSDRTAERRPC